MSTSVQSIKLKEDPNTRICEAITTSTKQHPKLYLDFQHRKEIVSAKGKNLRHSTFSDVIS